MAKKILFENFPDEATQTAMLEHLSQMEPKREPSLMNLMELLRTGIAKAKKSGVSWDDIAAYITETTGQEVSADAVAQSYMTSEREIKNRGKASFEISYNQLKTRYNMALRLLKEHGIEEPQIIDLITDERKKRQDKNKTKKGEQEHVEKNTDITPVDTTTNNGNFNNSSENKIREDKNIFGGD